MPIYDYLCSACGVTTEVIHGIDAPAPHYCPNCGKEGTLRKSFVAPTVVFKGSGWAKKDRSASRASKPGGETRDKAAAGAKDSDGSGASASGASSTRPAKPGADASSSSGSSSPGSSGSGSTRSESATDG